MTPTELIITVIASILAGTCIGVLITLVAMRHLLHTKDARIKILNEKLEALDKWSDTLFNEEDMKACYYQGRNDELDVQQVIPGEGKICEKVHPKETFQKWIQTTYRPVEPAQKPVDKIVAEMTVQAQHKESMNYWTAEGEMQQEDKRTPGAHQP